MPNICVVGGGPAGLYTSKYLIEHGCKVTLYEKSNTLINFFKTVISPFTKYTFRHFENLIFHKNFTIHLNKKIHNLKEYDHKYDAFLIATGSHNPKKLNIEGSKYFINAIDIAKNYAKDKYQFGKDVLIIGCGNVALDMVKYLATKR